MSLAHRDFLLEAAKHYAGSSPAMSRLLVYRVQRDLDRNGLKEFATFVCTACGALYVPGVNCDVDFKPSKAPGEHHGGTAVYCCRDCGKLRTFKAPALHGKLRKRRREAADEGDALVFASPSTPVPDLLNEPVDSRLALSKRERHRLEQQEAKDKAAARLAAKRAAEEKELKQAKPPCPPSAPKSFPAPSAVSSSVPKASPAPSTRPARGSFASFLSELDL